MFDVLDKYESMQEVLRYEWGAVSSRVTVQLLIFIIFATFGTLFLLLAKKTYHPNISRLLGVTLFFCALSRLVIAIEVYHGYYKLENIINWLTVIFGFITIGFMAPIVRTIIRIGSLIELDARIRVAEEKLKILDEIKTGNVYNPSSDHTTNKPASGQATATTDMV